MNIADHVNLGDLLDHGPDPDKTALIAVDTDGNARHFSYHVLDRAIAALSAELAGRGLRRGADRPARSIAEYLIAYFALMRGSAGRRAGQYQAPGRHDPIHSRRSAVESAFADRAFATLPPGLAAAARHDRN